jgi:rhamnogalacturonan endolyase
MRKYVLSGLLLVGLFSMGFDWLKERVTSTANAPRYMENLGRGIVAVRSSETDVSVSWRLLGFEPQDLPFNLYRSAGGGPAQKLNPEPLTGGTNFVDTTADTSAPNSYFVRPVINGVELAASVPYTLPANAPVRPYLTLPLQPAPDTYVHLIWVGDLDGDGEYDFIVSRLPLSSGRPQLIDAYKHDGTYLWRVDFGPNSVDPDNIEPPASAICAGHNDGVTVYDLDSDGRAEVVIKSANGVVFGDGNTMVFEDNVTQFISVLDGLTGAERARAPVPTDYIADGPVAGHFGVAYLDGVKPSFIFKAKNRIGNGGFNLFIAAWDFDGTNMTQRWKWLRGDQNCPDDHQIRIVDVDRDGRDEICARAATTTSRPPTFSAESARLRRSRSDMMQRWRAAPVR